MAFNSWSNNSGGWGVRQSPDEQLFYTLSPTNGLVSGEQVRSTFQQSGLSSQQLAQIWAQVDRDKDGFINIQEFCQAMSMIRQQKGSLNSSMMSNSISSSAFNPGGWGNANPSPAQSLPLRPNPTSMSLLSPTGSTGSPYLENKSFFPTGQSAISPTGDMPPSGGRGSSLGASSPMVGVSGGVGRNVSLASLTPSWSINPQDKQRYTMMFNTNDKDKTGFISGDAARTFLTRYNLEKDVLRKIWDLSDIDKDGRLSLEEFAIAMFLVEKATKGIPPPASLPPDLQPKKTPQQPGVSPTLRGGQSPALASNFEDKKKENFEKGRAELERRRKAIQEREQKEKEEKEKKRLEEEEKRRQAEMKIAAAREAEMEKQRQKALEIERERERAIQAALLKKEAEQREAEIKRKEEWVRRRRVELEEEKRHETEGLNMIKHQHQAIMDELTKKEVEKRTIKFRVEQERQRCAELATGLDQVRNQQSSKRELLVGVASEVKNWRQELAKMEFHRQQLQGRLAVQMTGNEGEVHSQLTNRQQTLAATLNRLRGVVTENTAKCQQIREESREKHAKTANMLTDIKGVEVRLARLKEKRDREREEAKNREQTSRRQQAFEETQRRQREVQERLKKQREDEKKKKMEEERKKEEEKRKREQYAKERRESIQDEELQEVLESELVRLKKLSISKKEQEEVPPVVKRGGVTRPRSQVLSSQEDEDVLKKVAELQARKRDLEQQRDSPKGQPKGLMGAFNELEGINFATGQQMNTPPIATSSSIALPTNTSHVYESPDAIKPPAATAKTTPTPNYNIGGGPIYESPDAVMPKGGDTSNRSSSQVKPDLPPKPEFFKRAKGNETTPILEPTITPTIEPTPTKEPDPTNWVQQQIRHYNRQEEATVSSNKSFKPEERLYDEPPRTVTPERPKVEEIIYSEPPKIDKPRVEERIYDEPPKIDIPDKQPVVEERIYDQPPLDLVPAVKVEVPVVGSSETPLYGNVSEPEYGNVSEPSQYENVSEPSLYGNVSEPSQYGNVSEPEYGNVWNEQSEGNPFLSNEGKPTGTGDVIPPTSSIATIGISYKAQFQYKATNEGEISFNQGDVLISCTGGTAAQDGWIKVERNGEKGWAPINYLQPLKSSDEQSSEKKDSLTPKMIVRVKHVWNGNKPNHLSLKNGQLITVKEKGESGWWLGELDGKVGWFPHKFVEEVPEPTPAVDPFDAASVQSALTPEPNNELYKAVYTFQGEHDGDLAFPEGSIITVLKKDGDWWMGEYNGIKGMFPSNYVSPLVDEPNPVEMDSLGIPILPPPVVENTPKGGRKHPLLGRVIVGFTAIEEGQLSLAPGQLVVVRRQESNGWWEGQLQSRGEERRCGWFPANRIELMTTALSSHTLSPKHSAPVASNTNTNSVTSTSGSGPEEAPPTTLVLALYSYTANSSDEISFHKGSVISLISKEEADWWKGELNGQTGLFPSNYVQPLDTLKQSDPIHWSDHVKPEIIDKVPPKERKRQEAIFELIHSEKSYVFSLNLVKEVFFIPLENSTILTPDELIQVFVNWEEIIEHNTAFCNALFIRLRTSGAIVRIIGDVLHDYIPQLSSHIRWCSCQLNACTLLQSKANDPQFKEFEQKCMKDSRTGGLPLSSFLLKPMQRVTKYPLLIKKILEYTQPSEADYELLLSSMTLAEDLCSQVNESVKQKENSEKLEWIQTHVQMTVSEKLVFNSSTNFMGSRKLLHCGKVLKVRGNKEMILFLFNDFLLLARPKPLFPTANQMEPFNPNNYFIMHREPFLLDQIQVRKIQDEQHAFTIIPKQSNEKDVPFKLETDVARDQWYKLIMEATINFTRRKKQSSKLNRSDSRRAALVRKSVGKLIVTVIEANDLVASSDGKSDPFCVVKIGDGQQGHTPVIKNSLNPQWNFAMEFFITDFESLIEISVFDSDLFSPNGGAKISLKVLREEKTDGPWTKRVLLEDVAKGEIELRIAFRQQKGTSQ